MNKPILCVDFDGVIHAYTSPWTDEVTISDGPVTGALEWLWNASESFQIAIYSSRSKVADAREAMAKWFIRYAQETWPDDMQRQADFMGKLTFPSQKPPAFLTIDDRAVCFEGDWSNLNPALLRNFKPWNKRVAA